jgi:hypothetical protein
MRRFFAVLFLLVVSPAISELLLGSTPISQSFTFPFLMAAYGAGALLIHELAVRRRMGWPRIVLLAAAFGLILEGIVFQTLFNPHFVGYLDVYGRWLGINWYWIEYIVGWHTIWTVCVPVLLTTLLFPEYQQKALLKRGGIIVAGIFCVLACAFLCFIYIKFVEHFSAAPGLLIGVGLIAVLLVVLALILPKRSRVSATPVTMRTIIPLWLVGLIVFILCLYWFGIHEFIKPSFPVPALLLNIFGIVLVVVAALLLNLWSVQYSHGDQRDAYLRSIVTGALPAGALMGAIIISDHKVVDQIGQTFLAVLVVVLLIVWNWRAYRQSVLAK